MANTTLLSRRTALFSSFAVALFSTTQVGAAKPKEIFPTTPTLSQQTGFQSAYTATLGVETALNNLANNTNSLNGGVTEGQGDGPGMLRSTLSPQDSKLQLFATYDYGSLDLEGENGIQSDTHGGSVGALYRVCSNFAFGGSIGGLSTRGMLAGGTGHVYSDGLTMSAFGVATFGNTFVDVIYNSTLLDNQFARQATGTNATGQTGSSVQTVAVTLGHNLRFGRFVTGPRLGVNYSHWRQDGYSENGTGALVEYANQNAESLVTRADWYASYDIKTNFGTVTPRGFLGWHRESMSGAGSSAVNAVGGGVFAATPGVSRVRSYLAAGAGVAVTLGGNWKASADYVGQYFGGAFDIHNVSLMLGYSF